MIESEFSTSLRNSRQITIRPVWNSWNETGKSWTFINPDTASRPYLHWQVSLSLNTEDANDVTRGTVVQKLWNAVEVRIRTLQEEYRFSAFRKFLNIEGKTDTLGILEQLGLVRPLVLRRLKALRNVIEHQDRGIPTHDECASLIDSVWYFLRSTDSIIVEKINHLEFEPSESASGRAARSQFVSFAFDHTDWSVNARGWFFPEDTAPVNQPHLNGLVLTLNSEPKYDDEGAAYISGTISPQSPGFFDFLRAYFRSGQPQGSIILQS